MISLLTQALVFFVIIIGTVKIYRLVFTVRKELSCTTAMMAAMIMGSMGGLLTGTVLAFNLSFSINTIVAMIIGIGIGIIIGLPFNPMTILEGMMAGVMGGLMGAMLGAMLKPDFIVILSFFLIALFLFSISLLNHAIKQETGSLKQTESNGGRIKSLSILIAFVTVTLCSIIMVGSFYETQPTINNNIDQNHTEHHHH
jgi:hypothetical protein